jgi:hypothetical protein
MRPQAGEIHSWFGSSGFFCNRVLPTPRKVTDGNNPAFAGHHQDKQLAETLALLASGACSDREW